MPSAPESPSSSSALADEPRQVAGFRRVISGPTARTTEYVPKLPSQFVQQPAGSFGAAPSTTTIPIDPINVAAPPALPTNPGQALPLPTTTTFPTALAGWYGYESADSQVAPQAASAALYGSGNVPSQPVPHGSTAAPTNTQSFQTLELGDMFSTQSMMYDQVLSNLSASLSGGAEQPHSAPGASGGSSSGQYAPGAQQPQPPADASSDNVQMPDNFTDLLASFGGDYGAIFPEFNDGAVNFSTWDSVPQGFGYVLAVSPDANRR